MINVIVYGRYKNARDAAWQCLIDFGISALPVDLLHIARQADIRIVKNSTVNELSGCESGACMFRGDRWYLIYDDECNLGRRRYTIAHEMGHIFLGHDMSRGTLRRSITANKPQSETEADIFASRLLAPACVLWGLDIHSAEDIARVCGISKTAAAIRAERMAVLYQRQRFLTSPLERRVYEQFGGYIQEHK